MQAGTSSNTIRGVDEDKFQDPNSSNNRRLSDRLKEADIERRLEQEEIDKRERAVEIKREARERKIALMQ